MVQTDRDHDGIFVVHVEIIGSHGQGTIDATYAELKHCFGEPKGRHDDHKCDVEWNIKFADGTIACIYNWKNGLNYCGVEDGLRLSQMTSFNVGGFNENAVKFGSLCEFLSVGLAFIYEFF